MKTYIEIEIDNESYTAEVEYSFFTYEETDNGEESCMIESIIFSNNIATQYGHSIQISEEVSDLIQKYYPEQYEDAEYRCLVDFKHRQAQEWTFTQEEQ
jgi:hypothetical protein